MILQNKWATLCCMLALSSVLLSCGDYWDGGEPVAARKMTLGRRVVNMLVGDRYRIPVLFEPDTLSNRSVWWQTEDKDIAIVENDTVIGISEGLTLAYAMSVSDRQTDSCWVNVLPEMNMNPTTWSSMPTSSSTATITQRPTRTRSSSQPTAPMRFAVSAR